jgi:hypothetical protein
LPNISNIYSYAFYYCTKLKTLDVGKAHKGALSFSNNAFNMCTKLSWLYIRNSKVATVGGSYCFSGTPLRNSSASGYIFVPGSLKSTYKGTTNWKPMENKFYSLESYFDLKVYAGEDTNSVLLATIRFNTENALGWDKYVESDFNKQENILSWDKYVESDFNKQENCTFETVSWKVMANWKDSNGSTH